jgi:hypothetical protein
LVRKFARDIKVNLKSFHAYVGFRDTVGPKIHSDGIKEFDHKEMCSIVNDYFGTVFSEEAIVGKILEVIKTGIDDSGCMLSNVDIVKEDINE